jgi:hypothetical protein
MQQIVRSDEALAACLASIEEAKQAYNKALEEARALYDGVLLLQEVGEDETSMQIRTLYNKALEDAWAVYMQAYNKARTVYNEAKAQAHSV